MHNQLYQTIFQKTSSLLLFCAIGAYAFERVLDSGVEQYFQTVNKGVNSLPL